MQAEGEAVATWFDAGEAGHRIGFAAAQDVHDEMLAGRIQNS
jgi:hypothetical protein